VSKQNAKVENDWYETHDNWLLSLQIPKTLKKFLACEGQMKIAKLRVDQHSPRVLTNSVILTEPRWHGFLENLV
jgi:hypothetical protein